MSFFQKTFLVVNIAMKVVIKMPVLTLAKMKINFASQELNWRTYTLDKILSTTKRLQIIDWKKFTTLALAPDEEAFVIHVAYLEAKILIYLAWKAQIALLLAKKMSIPE